MKSYYGEGVISGSRVLVVILLLMCRYPIFTTAYPYGSNCSSLAVANETLRLESDIYGGRDIRECDVNCRERITYGVVCYSDVTWEVFRYFINFIFQYYMRFMLSNFHGTHNIYSACQFHDDMSRVGS